MKEDRKAVTAIDMALARIQDRPASQISTADLQLLMLQRIDNRLRELVRLQQTQSRIDQIHRAVNAEQAEQPKPMKDIPVKSKSFFSRLFRNRV